MGERWRWLTSRSGGAAPPTVRTSSLSPNSGQHAQTLAWFAELGTHELCPAAGLACILARTRYVTLAVVMFPAASTAVAVKSFEPIVPVDSVAGSCVSPLTACVSARRPRRRCCRAHRSATHRSCDGDRGWSRVDDERAGGAPRFPAASVARTSREWEPSVSGTAEVKGDVHGANVFHRCDTRWSPRRRRRP